jgi:hypothetical protein
MSHATQLSDNLMSILLLLRARKIENRSCVGGRQGLSLFGGNGIANSKDCTEPKSPGRSGRFPPFIAARTPSHPAGRKLELQSVFPPRPIQPG